MFGAILKDPSAFVLGEIPPRRGLANRDESSARRLRATKCWLPCGELVFFGSRYVTLVACESPQHPFCTVGSLWNRTSYDVQACGIGEGGADDGAHAHNSPCSGHAAYEGKESGIHRLVISFVAPNGLRLSGEGSRAKRVRCSRGLGPTLKLMRLFDRVHYLPSAGP